MKNALTFMVILSMGLISSCEVVEIDQLNSTDNELSTIDGLQGPQTAPNTEAEIVNFFHGGSAKLWEAEGFTLFGMSGFLPCRLDDSMRISSDGSYTYDGGSSLCGAEDSTPIKEGTWKLSDDLSSIVFTEGSNSYTAELIGITNDQITLRGDYQGIELNAVYTSN